MNKEMDYRDKPLSELYRLAAEDWADEQSAWYTLSEGKATCLAKLKQGLADGDAKLSEAKLDRLARNLPEWQEWLDRMSFHNHNRLLLAARKESIHMRYYERQGQNADARKEKGMHL